MSVTLRTLFKKTELGEGADATPSLPGSRGLNNGGGKTMVVKYMTKRSTVAYWNWIPNVQTVQQELVNIM